MNEPIVPPCAGKWLLFDSTDIVDHREAATLCGTCPMRLECHGLLRAAIDASPASIGPAGTWAGKLVGLPAHQTAQAGAA